MKHNAALLQWVLINDEMQHVSSYAHLKPQLRPRAVCPVCEEPVIMKLGSKKVHHVAHSAGSNCVLTKPESALHFNCKMHIARQLETSNSLKLTETCASCSSNEREIIWQQDWDKVKVERKLIDLLQPDVALWKGDQPIAAIEVFVTHAVDKEKSDRLELLEIPWIEIIGQESLYLGNTAWQAGIPIPANKISWKVNWRCDACVMEEQEIRKQEEWERNNGEHPICFKLIDWFFPYGRWLRCLFIVNKVLKDGQVIEFNLVYVKTSLNYQRIKSFEENQYYVQRIDGSLNEHEAVETLKREGKAYLTRKRKKQNLKFDSPMPWIDGEPGHFEGFDSDVFPRRYFFNKKTQEWFIPKDKQNELWYTEDGTPIFREREYRHHW